MHNIAHANLFDVYTALSATTSSAFGTAITHKAAQNSSATLVFSQLDIESVGLTTTDGTDGCITIDYGVRRVQKNKSAQALS